MNMAPVRVPRARGSEAWGRVSPTRLKPPEGGTLTGSCLAALVCGLLGWLGAASPCPAQTQARAPESPREYYNEGTRRFREGKLREAEAALQTAVGGTDERVQPPALYNLGHVRYRQGVEVLQDTMKPDKAKARGDAASRLAEQAIQAANAALRDNSVEAITRAYMQGRGARKELKAALEAVKKAMENYGAVLSRWQRASGDFKSAFELRPAQDEARFNAQVVDDHIAELVNQKEMVQQSLQGMEGNREKLKNLMQELKKRIPGGEMKDQEGDDDEDEDEPPKQPQSGSQEKANTEGREMTLTWEEAMRLLEGLRLDGNRKLPMGDKETATPKDRKGKDW